MKWFYYYQTNHHFSIAAYKSIREIFLPSIIYIIMYIWCTWWSHQGYISQNISNLTEAYLFLWLGCEFMHLYRDRNMPAFHQIPLDAAAQNQTQSAFRIQCASSLTALLHGVPDLWDSGRVRFWFSQSSVLANAMFLSLVIIQLWLSSIIHDKGWDCISSPLSQNVFFRSHQTTLLLSVMLGNP